MAQSLTTNNSGIVSPNLNQILFASSEIVDQNLIPVIEGIQFREALPKMEIPDVLMQARVSNPASAGTITYTENYLQPASFISFLTFPIQPWEALYKGYAPEGQLLIEQLPQEVQVNILYNFLNKTKTEWELCLWSGSENGTSGASTSYLNRFTGFIPRALADASVNKITGTTLTTSNAIAEAQKFVTAIPSIVYSQYRQNLKIFTSWDTWRLLQTASQNLSQKGPSIIDTLGMTLSGIKVYPLVNFPPNTFYSTYTTNDSISSNMVIGMNDLGDLNNISMGKTLPTSEDWFIKLICKTDTQHIWGRYITLYGGTN